MTRRTQDMMDREMKRRVANLETARSVPQLGNSQAVTRTPGSGNPMDLTSAYEAVPGAPVDFTIVGNAPGQRALILMNVDPFIDNATLSAAYISPSVSGPVDVAADDTWFCRITTALNDTLTLFRVVDDLLPGEYQFIPKARHTGVAPSVFYFRSWSAFILQL